MYSHNKNYNNKMAAKLDVQKYEARLDFLQNELYTKRDELNNLFLESGKSGMFHNFLFEVNDIHEKYPDALLDIAHKVTVICDVCGELTLQGKLRNTTVELNTLLEEASKINIRLDLAQNIVYLDEIPTGEDEEYTGRWALVIEISAPNLDEALKS